jgi:hypothetical protein
MDTYLHQQAEPGRPKKARLAQIDDQDCRLVAQYMTEDGPELVAQAWPP